MRIGRVAFQKSVRVCCFLPGNGHDRQLTQKTLSRKFSSSFGDETTRLTTARCFTPRCVRSLSILSVGTNAVLGGKPLFLPRLIQRSSRSLNGEMRRNRRSPRQSAVCHTINARCSY